MAGRSPCLTSRRSSASAAQRYCVGLTPNPRKTPRHAANDGSSLSDVSPIRSRTALVQTRMPLSVQPMPGRSSCQMHGSRRRPPGRIAFEDGRVVAEAHELAARSGTASPGCHPGRANSKPSNWKAGETVHPTKVQSPRLAADCQSPAGTSTWGDWPASQVGTQDEALRRLVAIHRRDRELERIAGVVVPHLSCIDAMPG